MRYLLISLLLVLNFTALSQDIYNAKTLCYGIYNKKTKQFDWNENTEDVSLKITVHGKLILVDDKAKSFYNLTGSPIEDDEDGVKSAAWTATDEKKIKCTIVITITKGYVMLFVFYADFSLAYGDLEKEEKEL